MAHRHRWSVADFLIVGDRPMMRTRCACGAERDLPAWNRQWEPPETD